jgi:predicted acylesterase/phospholipase RssA
VKISFPYPLAEPPAKAVTKDLWDALQMSSIRKFRSAKCSGEGIMTYRILSLDGGGIRGVIAAIWLGELARRNPQLLQSIDLYAGTSVGAANAVAFAKKLPLEDIIDIYKKDGPVLFGQ